MTTLAEPIQHFAGAPEWTWYILFYFFLAGLSGGSYFIASLFRLRGGPADQAVARLGYYVSFLALPLCPVMLILDLGSPLRFWHMMWNTTPGEQGLNFKYWSPMSVGVWALLVFGAFATLSSIEAFVRDRRPSALRLLDGVLGNVITVVGAALGLFIAGYTGVLLSVSNQPVWSDTWALGGLFLASGLAGSAALLTFLLRYRADARPDAAPLTASEGIYSVLELAMIVVFAATMIRADAFDAAFGPPWTLLWLVALAGLLPGLLPGLRVLLPGRLATTPEGVALSVPTVAAASSVAVTGLVLLGVLALRAAIIFSIQ